MRNLDLSRETDRICNFIQSYLQRSGFEKVIIGLSGGVDSSLSAALAVKALGNRNVYGAMLPWKDSSQHSYSDALTLAEGLRLHHEKIDITPMVESYFHSYQHDADKLRWGNWMARIRMCVLYDLSAKYNALVVGTSNRTELLTGYFTQNGDGASAFEPIGHLYKTDVWKMAKFLALPEVIINKVPTADLWAGQIDEGELGLNYPEIDEILYLLTEECQTAEHICEKGIGLDKVNRVISLMKSSQFKRQLPPLITTNFEKA